MNFNSPSPERDARERQLKADVEQFLKNGGSVKRLSPLASASEGLDPASRRMRKQSLKNAHRHRRLTMEQARDVRSRYNGTRGCIKRLAKEHGVTIDVISSIINGRTYLEA